MSSISERSRNNIRAGVFVSLALIVSLGVVVAVTDALSAFGRKSENYTVTFNVRSGVASLKKGSEVRLGGVALGRVTHVGPDFEAVSVSTIDVDFKVDSRVKLNSDATIAISAPLIGTDASLEISSIGDPTKPLADGQKIEGHSSDGMLDSFLGADSAANTRETLANVKKFSEFLPTIPDEYETRVVPILDDAGAVVSELRNDHWPKWAKSVDNVMEWADRTTVTLETAFNDGKDTLAETKAIVTENREPIKNSIANVESVTDRIKNETVDKINAVLETGQKGLDEAKAAIDTFRVDYANWATNLDDTMANLTLTSQQLKLASIETRRSPWKLLYKPEPKELEHELLYEATRAFAVAAADLKATSESARRILANHSDIIVKDEALYRKLEQNVRDSLERYENAQQDMFDVLLSERQP